MIYCPTTIMRDYDRPHHTNCFHSKLELYIVYQNQTQPNQPIPNTNPVRARKNKSSLHALNAVVSCAQCKCKCNSMQSKNFSYRMQMFTHLISFCLSSCSLIHYFHICENFQNKIRWNFMIIHACDKWLDAHKNNSNNSSSISNSMDCDFGKPVFWRKLMVW